jgi:hypothetical protein
MLSGETQAVGNRVLGHDVKVMKRIFIHFMDIWEYFQGKTGKPGESR